MKAFSHTISSMAVLLLCGTVHAQVTPKPTGNTANGTDALHSNTTGGYNTADGYQALYSNTAGNYNTATGSQALYSSANAIGSNNNNTADGYQALYSNTAGTTNTAVGANALYYCKTGDNNIAIGWAAGSSLATGNNNIYIGSDAHTADNNTIRIGGIGIQTTTCIAGIYGATASPGVAVYVDANGHLGTIPSSQRFKANIRDMGSASEAILALRPVAFRYKPEIDPTGTPQFGLVAEEVERISPDLVVCDKQGQAYTVRYEAVNAMLLNEFQKQHEHVKAQDEVIAKQQDDIAALRAQVEALAKAVANK